LVFEDDIAVGHAGDVIADGAVQAGFAGAASGLLADEAGYFEVMEEKLFHHEDGALIRLMDDGVVIEVFVKVFAEFLVQLAAGGAVVEERFGEAPGVVGGVDGAGAQACFAGADDVADFAVDDAADGEVPAAFVVEWAVLGFDLARCVAPDADLFIELGFGEEAGIETVIEVVAVVGDFIGEVGDLSFEGRGEEVVGGWGGEGMIVACLVFGEAFADFPGEVKAGERGIFLFEVFDDAEALAIVFESAVVEHEAVEDFLPFMAEGGMAEVMGEGDGFGEIFVEAEGASDVAGDGGDLDGVSQARAEVIPSAVKEDLGFVFEAAECAGMNDAVAVALVVGAPVWRRFGVLAAS
jgi:hypothetical protein